MPAIRLGRFSAGPFTLGPSSLLPMVLALVVPVSIPCLAVDTPQIDVSRADSAIAQGTVFYQPTLDSLRKHPVPAWFHDAKFGIFVHWGIYAVPGWAPPTGELRKVLADSGWAGWFRNNPYSEWYANSMKIEGSPTQRHHAETYGAQAPYEDFASAFNQAAQAWNPAEWGALFKQAGARYAVLTTKHHDGFTLWPSAFKALGKPDFHADRDLVKDFFGAMQDADITPGAYYSGGLDWTFKDRKIQNLFDLFLAIPQGFDYARHASNQWRELIARYSPKVMWNDIGYPWFGGAYELMADYYNAVPLGVINDRFSFRAGSLHHDFETPEYTQFEDTQSKKWESTRGLGYSFGYNQRESDSHLLSTNDLVDSFVDIVSKNGNLLLNVGPRADGTIPEIQRRRLLEFGSWLKTHGQGIYATRPWRIAAGRTASGGPVRFTQSNNRVFAFLLNEPKGSSKVILEGLSGSSSLTVTLLGGTGEALKWRNTQDGLHIEIPKGGLKADYAQGLQLTPGSMVQF